MSRLISILYLLITLLAVVILFTDWIPEHFIFLFIGIGSFASCIEDIWEWRKKPNLPLSSFDRFMKISHFVLCPLCFLAFLVQHCK